jgi:imidazolonepropionase-like amidohydrolase
VGWCAALALLLAGPALAGPLALVGATVHTVSGPTVERGVVLVEGGRILAVGTSVTPPPDATVVHLEGKHLYPGLISPNTVLGLVEVMSVRGTLDLSETGRINPNVRAEAEINPDSDLLPVTRANGVTTALVAPRGGAIAGTSALVHLDGWTWEDMTVRAPVGLHVMWPTMTPSRSRYERRSGEEQRRDRDQAIREIRDAFADARAYWKATRAEGRPGVPRHDRDPRWEAMSPVFEGTLPVFLHASALNQIRAALRFADQESLKRVVLVGGYDAWRMADELRKRDIPVIVDPALTLPRRDYESYDAAFTTAARLYQAGVRFCIGDGGGMFTVSNSRNLPYHAAMAAAFGLPHEEALKAITLYPAQILGAGEWLGSIEPGKEADLIVTTGDPLEIETHIERVWIAGRECSLENRQTRLFHKYEAKPRGPKARK